MRGRWCWLLALVMGAGFLTSCASREENDFFRSGRDARIYNPQTGRYEWPEGD